MKILLLNASPRAARSRSRAAAADLIASLRAGHPDATVVERDLSAQPVPFVDETWIAAAFTPDARRTPAMREALRVSDELIDELLAADTIVIATPKYNFGVPAALKAWIDQIIRVNRTFAMPGFQGLAKGRKVYVLVASGSEPQAASDHLTPFLRQVFAMIGIDDLSIVPVVEGAARPISSAA